MNCPPEIAETLLGILGVGIMRTRTAAWSNNSERCAIEADHLHNLPALLTSYSPDLLRFYWEVEHVAFLNQIQKEDTLMFEAHWSRLEAILSRECLSSLAS